MIKKHLTCKTNLEPCGDNVIVARLDTDSHDQNAVHYETDPVIKHTRHYLSGEIANTLYAYEQLGFTPDELRGMINELRLYKAREDYRNYLIVGGRCNGKTIALQKAMYEYLAKDYLDGLKAKVTTIIDDVHMVKPDLWMLSKSFNVPSNLRIEKVIFNDPATIVIWKDGTKTVVKATNEKYDPEKGLAMAITKKALGNKGNYFETIKKWTGEYEEKPVSTVETKTYPIKNTETCKRCNWGADNPGCAQHKYCEGCPNLTDNRRGCKCGDIRDGEPCKYFEEVSNNG